VQDRPLPLWVAYAQAVAFFFIGLILLDWLAYVIWGHWIEWWGVLAVAMVIPGLGLMITWDEV
jgi:hypothetical protein